MFKYIKELWWRFLGYQPRNFGGQIIWIGPRMVKYLKDNPADEIVAAKPLLSTPVPEEWWKWIEVKHD